MNRHFLILVFSLLVTTSVSAGQFQVSLTIPKLNVAEYHRPYVAVWIETVKGKHQADIAVWYDTKLKNKKGTKWLKDLRLWWRKSGRQLDMPIDGLSSATRPVGLHKIKLPFSHPVLQALNKGEYQLVIEASREVGGREVVRIPFSWPAEQAQTGSVTGQHELGKALLSINP